MQGTVSVVLPQAGAGESDIQTRDFFRIHGWGEESLRYWPMEVMRRASPSVLFQVERQTREIRRLAAESGRGKGVVFTSVKAILAAESATSLPGIPAWEGTHWKAISHPSLLEDAAAHPALASLATLECQYSRALASLATLECQYSRAMARQGGEDQQSAGGKGFPDGFFQRSEEMADAWDGRLTSPIDVVAMCEC
ncbi:hypothetical protein GWK47_053428 [Chionoecetes opilio]|uniref:Uncharacterized protein n=1 Tax=Chionoecetes opilio TaxID=41210 RepID=A0A8J5CQS9_CHIOP|nr:hypothetical protein GWK47_053428 [Chionoecetes opilio]